jgi:hypothetical protein
MDQRTLEDIHRGFRDDETFARESLTVQNKLGHLVPMEFGPAQQKLAAVIVRQRELRRPVRIIVLKARQVWISTYVASRFFRDTTARAGQHTLVLAHDEKTVNNIFSYYNRFQTHYKPFRGVIRLPGLTSDRQDALEYDNGSWIKIHTAANANIGRSFTLRRIHFSEYAFYLNARLLMASAMGAMPDDPDTEAIIESSPNGVGNEFHQMWEKAVAGESEWIPFFFAWWEHPEYTRALDVAPDAFQRSLTSEEREMMALYGLTLEQLNWRRWCIRNRLNGDESLFRQEYPSCPEEAFLTSGRPRFDYKALQRMPVVRDAIEGGLEMEELGGRKRLMFLPRERGEIVVFRKPQENREYVIGADVAEGIDVADGRGEAKPDYSVAQVLDRDTGEQVARFRARVQAAEFGWQLFMLGVYFNWAQIVPEANGPGLACIDELLRQSYPADLIYHRIRTADQDPRERADLIGWKTTAVTRPQLISLLDSAIREAAIIIRDPITVQECRTFVIKPNGKAEHQDSCHDDTVIALALGVVGIAQMPRKRVPALKPDSRMQVKNYRTRHDNQDERGMRLRLL